jgi:hypothetical protein
MIVFDDNFSVEVFQFLLLQFNEVERKKIADCPNIVRHPPYSRKVRNAFVDLMKGGGKAEKNAFLPRHMRVVAGGGASVK